MYDEQPMLLPGSRSCIGCGALTFRARQDQLCPRCAFESEKLIEGIELQALEHDLQLLVAFEGYCHQHPRDEDEGSDPPG